MTTKEEKLQEVMDALNDATDLFTGEVHATYFGELIRLVFEDVEVIQNNHLQSVVGQSEQLKAFREWTRENLN